jgi:hypothetical protein
MFKQGDSNYLRVHRVSVLQPFSSQTHPYTLISNKNFSHPVLIPIFIDQLPINEYEDEDFDLECTFVLYIFGLSQSVIVTNTYLEMSDQTMK